MQIKHEIFNKPEIIDIMINEKRAKLTDREQQSVWETRFKMLIHIGLKEETLLELMKCDNGFFQSALARAIIPSDKRITRIHDVLNVLTTRFADLVNSPSDFMHQMVTALNQIWEVPMKTIAIFSGITEELLHNLLWKTAISGSGNSEYQVTPQTEYMVFRSIALLYMIFSSQQLLGNEL